LDFSTEEGRVAPPLLMNDLKMENFSLTEGGIFTRTYRHRRGVNRKGHKMVGFLIQSQRVSFVRGSPIQVDWSKPCRGSAHPLCLPSLEMEAGMTLRSIEQGDRRFSLLDKISMHEALRRGRRKGSLRGISLRARSSYSRNSIQSSLS
jgi:hypothetical protein